MGTCTQKLRSLDSIEKLENLAPFLAPFSPLPSLQWLEGVEESSASKQSRCAQCGAIPSGHVLTQLGHLLPWGAVENQSLSFLLVIVSDFAILTMLYFKNLPHVSHWCGEWWWRRWENKLNKLKLVNRFFLCAKQNSCCFFGSYLLCWQDFDVLVFLLRSN